MCHELEKPFSDGECFFAEMIKGNATARWAKFYTDFYWNQPYKKGRKMNKESIDLGRLYRVRELAEICGVKYRIGLNEVQLGEIDSVKICRTYLIIGEMIQDRLNQQFMLY